ncbi:hypothetical protein [Parasitella parasitica]|uniref:Uncharacterized protein n=1 Tax=Parasitella parasitica TaxID=35722 RepID=A0A0B7N9T3_9FUNG|nr:hypothetical protein [Parasitella parasitica]
MSQTSESEKASTAVPSQVPVARSSNATVESVDARQRESPASFMHFSEARGAYEDSGSVPDGESLKAEIALCKEHYELVVRYVTVGRQDMVDTAIKRLHRAETVRKSMAHLHPMEHAELQEIIAEQEANASELQQMVIITYDGQPEDERTRMQQRLLYLLHCASGGEVNEVVHDLQWPTLAVSRLTIGTRLSLDNKQEIAMTRKDDKNTAKDMKRTYLERRKRHRFNQFEKGSAYEAEQWMQRYEVLENYLRFTSEEDAAEELVVGVLTGAALDWLIEGDDPAMVAFNELKSYKQGNKLMTPELAPSVIMARVTTLVDGIKVATDIERSLHNSAGNTYMGPIYQARTSESFSRSPTEFPAEGKQEF